MNICIVLSVVVAAVLVCQANSAKVNFGSKVVGGKVTASASRISVRPTSRNVHVVTGRVTPTVVPGGNQTRNATVTRGRRPAASTTVNGRRMTIGQLFDVTSSVDQTVGAATATPTALVDNDASNSPVTVNDVGDTSAPGNADVANANVTNSKTCLISKLAAAAVAAFVVGK